MVKLTDNIDDIFEDIWQQRQAARTETPIPEEPIGRCVYNRHFEAWTQQICQKALQQPSVISINQAMLQIFKKYMVWRSVIPKAHRNQIGERGHRCVFHTMEQAYYQLMACHLALSGEDLFELPAPPQPVTVINKYNYAGFPIGETVVEDDEDE